MPQGRQQPRSPRGGTETGPLGAADVSPAGALLRTRSEPGFGPCVPRGFPRASVQTSSRAGFSRTVLISDSPSHPGVPKVPCHAHAA